MWAASEEAFVYLVTGAIVFGGWGLIGWLIFIVLRYLHRES